MVVVRLIRVGLSAIRAAAARYDLEAFNLAPDVLVVAGVGQEDQPPSVQAWGWSSAPPHKPPYVKAEWLEKAVWDDVRSFLEIPGEVLERVGEQMGDEGEAEKFERRRGDLGKRLAGKERYVRL